MIGHGLDTAIVQQDLSLWNCDSGEGVDQQGKIVVAGIDK